MRRMVVAFVLGTILGGVSWAGAGDLFHFTPDETVTLKRVALQLSRLNDEQQTRLFEKLVDEFDRDAPVHRPNPFDSAAAIDRVDVVETAVESRPRPRKAQPADYEFVE